MSRTQILAAKEQKSLKSLKKSIPKNQIKKIKNKKQTIRTEMTHVSKKPLERKKILFKQKSGLKWTIIDWKNDLEKNLIEKTEKKTENIKVKLPHVNKKNHQRDSEFLFIHRYPTIFKIRAKKFHSSKPLAFLLRFLFQRRQNHYSNLISKIMNLCEQILNIAGRLPENSRDRSL